MHLHRATRRGARLVSVLLILWTWSLGAAAGPPPYLVFVTVLPLKTFVERIGGPHVRVEAMVQPGHSPSTYDPTPRQVTDLSRADLYVRAGVPFEDAWMRRIRSANPSMAVLDAHQGIEFLAHEGHDHGHGDGPDPHVWSSPETARRMAANIRDGLTALDPAHRADFEANYAACAAELDALDAEIHATLSGLESRRFMVYHPSWGYFAETYGLTQIPIEREGKEPGARALAGLIEQARREGIRVILVQPQYARKAAEQVARAVGGRVESVDPLSEDYFGNLRRLARLIAEERTP